MVFEEGWSRLIKTKPEVKKVRIALGHLFVAKVQTKRGQTR
jgi:hypothetical protein